jgi:hypothetical protein
MRRGLCCLRHVTVALAHFFKKKSRLRLHWHTNFVWLVADGWCWFVLREKYCWLVAGDWFVLREK